MAERSTSPGNLVHEEETLRLLPATAVAQTSDGEGAGLPYAGLTDVAPGLAATRRQTRRGQGRETGGGAAGGRRRDRASARSGGVRRRLAAAQPGAPASGPVSAPPGAACTKL